MKYIISTGPTLMDGVIGALTASILVYCKLNVLVRRNGKDLKTKKKYSIGNDMEVFGEEEVDGIA